MLWTGSHHGVRSWMRGAISGVRAPNTRSLRIAQYTRAAVWFLLVFIFALFVLTRRALSFRICGRAGLDLDVLSRLRGGSPRTGVRRVGGCRCARRYRTYSLGAAGLLSTCDYLFSFWVAADDHALRGRVDVRPEHKSDKTRRKPFAVRRSLGDLCRIGIRRRLTPLLQSLLRTLGVFGMRMAGYYASQVPAGGLGVFLDFHRPRVKVEGFVKSGEVRIFVQNLFGAHLRGLGRFPNIEIEPCNFKLVHRQYFLHLVHQLLNLFLRVSVRVSTEQILQLALGESRMRRVPISRHHLPQMKDRYL